MKIKRMLTHARFGTYLVDKDMCVILDMDDGSSIELRVGDSVEREEWGELRILGDTKRDEKTEKGVLARFFGKSEDKEV